MATGKTILLGALRLLNVKQSAEVLESDELEDGKNVLNELIDAWSNEKLMQPALVEVTHTLTSSDGTYTIGSGGDIDVTRPLSIESMYIRRNDLDYKVTKLENQEFSSIYNKTTESDFPSSFYYRESYPLGEINFYPIPSEANTLVMQVWTQISQITNMDTVLTLPPGYNRALRYNLAIDLAPEYSAGIPPAVAQVAKDSKAWIKTANYGQVMRQKIEAAQITNRGYRANVNTGGFS